MPNSISNLEVKINCNNLNKKLNLQNEFKNFEHTVETQKFLYSIKGHSSSRIPTVEEYFKSPVTMTLKNTIKKMTEKNVIFDKLPTKVNTSNNRNCISPTESPYLNPSSILIKYGYDIKVYSATHILSNRTVAIKCLDKKKIKQNFDLTERVFREITLLKSINHNNICQLLQLIDSPHYIHMVLEYESGGELYDEIVKKSRLPLEECQIYFKQLVSAIDYCHNLGIVHRDLKPENILLDKHKKNVKIIDFGFSNLIKNNSYKLRTFCGSIAYAAPEVLSSRNYDGKKADIWSLGIILYVMLVGQVPFKGRYVKVLYESIVNKEYEIPDYVPEDARDLIEKMLIIEPEKRINMDEILIHPWITNPVVTRRTSSDMDLRNINYMNLANENEIIDKIIEICKNNNISENKIKLHDQNDFDMEQHDFNSKEFRESIINSISIDEPSSIKALYFLLKEEKIELLEKQMSKSSKMDSLEVTKENNDTINETICKKNKNNKEVYKKEQSNISVTTGVINSCIGNITDNQNTEFLPRTSIDDQNTTLLFNSKYEKMSIGVSTVKNGYNASNNSNIKSSDTPIFNHYDLSPPVEEFNTSIFIPPYQNNTKFVNEIKINSQYNISAPVKHNRYQTYLASFQYGIKNLNGDKEENSVLEVKANNLFPPQLSEISCSSFNEFATAVCKYLESHHIKYTESVNYEGDKSDVYHSHSS
ncbi:Pkinase-domain-containing protein [Neocallimastix sp. 'constans']